MGEYVSRVAEEAEKDLPATQTVYVLVKQRDDENRTVTVLGTHPDVDSAKAHAAKRWEPNPPPEWRTPKSTATAITEWLGTGDSKIRYTVLESTLYPKDHFKEIS